jgi:hypothetical protein
MKRELFLLGGIGLGAGLMYWLDPARGRHRRARTRAQLLSGRHLVGDLMADASRELHELRWPRRYRAQLVSPVRRQRQRMGSDAVLLTLGVLGLSAILSWMAKSRYTTLRSGEAASETTLQSVCDWACGVWDGVNTWFRPEAKALNSTDRTYEREHEVTMMGVEAESTKEAESQ